MKLDLFPPTTRPGIASRIATNTALLGLGMSMNALDAQERGVPVTPSVLVDGAFAGYRDSMQGAFAAARRVAPELEQTYVAAEDAIAGLLQLAATHAADTTTVLPDDAAIQVVLDEYEQRSMPVFAAALAIDPSIAR